MLEKRINDDTIVAMKDSDKFKLSVLRMLKSDLKSEAINLKKELTDDDVIAVIRRQIKTRNASVIEYTKFNRMDTVSDLNKEIEILSSYLPKELSLEEINQKLDEIFAKFDNPTIKQMGLIIKEAKEVFGSSVDMAKVSSLVKERLQ